MLNEQKRHAGVGWKMGQQLRKSFQAARRSTNADYRKGHSVVRSLAFKAKGIDKDVWGSVRYRTDTGKAIDSVSGPKETLFRVSSTAGQILRVRCGSTHRRSPLILRDL